jgi:hypothetical protein
MQLEHSLSNKRTKLSFIIRGGLLLVIFLTCVSGTIRTFADIPAAQNGYQQEGALVQNLLKIGATRIYSDYWTCNRLMFRSREQIICSALDDQLNPGIDRYLPYRSLVRGAPHQAYVFAVGSSVVDVLKRQLQSSDIRYRAFTFEGFRVFQII